MAGSVARTRFVGRGAELARLEAAFARAGAGQPLTVCLGGEAGVGKTRLAGEFAARASQRGGQVLLGGCIELGEGALPFAPMAEALRGLSRDREPAALDELLGPGRSLLARLVPDLGQVPAEPARSRAPGGLGADPAAQAGLFEAVLALLERLTARAPTVLVVEDLHWADQSTLDLLSFLVHNVQAAALLLLLTYRSDELHRRHPLRPFLAGLDRGGGPSAWSWTASGARTWPRCSPACSGKRPTPGCSSGSSSARRATPSSPRNWWPPAGATTGWTCRRAWRTPS